MKLPAFDRRRRQRFAELVQQATPDAGLNGSHRQDGVRRLRKPDADLVSLVQLTQRVRNLRTAPQPEPDFRKQLRAMLKAKVERHNVAAHEELTTTEIPRPPSRSRARHPQNTSASSRTRAALLTGVIAGALTLSGVSAASTDALPGDPLYQVKRSGERAQLALAGSDISRAQLYLEFAHARIIEAQQVNSRLLTEVLADMDSTTRQGVSLLHAAAVQRSDPATLDVVLRFVTAQRERVREVDLNRGSLAAAGLQASFALLDSAETRAKALATAMHKGCGAGPIDALGPEPGC
jgi:uncharacterized protein DUF5667